MRPLSMTAFGRGEHTRDGRTWVVEIRSVNHRYCDINVKIPRKYLALESRVKKEIALHYQRGRIDVFIDLAGRHDASSRLKPDLTLAREYYTCLVEIKKDLDLAGVPDLPLFSTFLKDIITTSEEEEDLEMIWQDMAEALNLAFGRADIMRQAEGEHLKNDLIERLLNFEKAVLDIDGDVSSLLEKKKTALTERMNRLLDNINLDPTRLDQEFAFLIDRSDVTEELVRLKSHIKQFRSYLEMDEPAGRRLDFLTQEFLRELNTMAAKINDVTVSHRVVELKNELEKMREQVQNIE